MPVSYTSRRRFLLVLVLSSLGLTLLSPEAGHGLDVIRPTGNPAKGRDVFVSKGCIACHSVRGAGGKAGPDLAAALVNKGILEVAAALWSHAPTMAKEMAARGVERPTLSPTEVKDLIAYLLFIGFAGEPGDPTNGRRVFNAKGCGKCHGRTADPDQPAPPLDPMPRPLTPIGIAQAMWNHGPQMEAKLAQMQLERPAFKRGEMADLVAFLLGPKRPALPADAISLPGDPTRGEQLFESKHCARCHRPDETGRTLGPDLSSGTWYNTSTELAAVMWNHGPGMIEAIKSMQLEVPRFEGNELADILAYLYLLKSGERLGDPSRGKATFEAKHCAQCHSKGGPGRDLAQSEALKAPENLASAMWNHAPQMESTAKARGIEWPELTGPDLRDLVAFLLASGRAEKGVSH